MAHPSWENNPQLFAEVNLEKNAELTFYGKPVHVLELACGTNKKLDWICKKCQNEWIATGNSRTNMGSGCPACAGKAVHTDGHNSMAETHPRLAVEYQGDASKILAGTHKKLPWKCSTCDNEWTSSGKVRSQLGVNCPACSNQAIHSDGRNSMSVTHPELAKEYLGDATQIIAGTSRMLEWKCIECSHIWRASGHKRKSEDTGCPACANRVIHYDGRNSMSVTHPELAKEYLGDATKITAGTNQVLRWKCGDCNQIWKTAGFNRSKHKSGCPACASPGYNPSKIGFIYIHHYSDDSIDWLKCGITNNPTERLSSLKRSASRFNIEIVELDLYKFDDGTIPQNCERELLEMTEIRFESNYDISGKSEFFEYGALDAIRKFIEKW